jgi:hypothetical protein
MWYDTFKFFGLMVLTTLALAALNVGLVLLACYTSSL